MSAVKNNLDPFFQRHAEAFDQGESFGRHAARQELLPLLKALETCLMFKSAPGRIVRAVGAVIADIECPPVTPKPTTPTDDESIPF
jgi:hypothetical protein